jgi:hypothetical protein
MISCRVSFGSALKRSACLENKGIRVSFCNENPD